MVRILGNSSERVKIKDLNDVIYYRQLKDYTDQEYENSKDLQREVKKHRLAKIDTQVAPKGSVDVQGLALLNARDLKAALREVLPEFKGNGVSEDSLKSAVREVAPLIVDMVRQEISKISIMGTPEKSKYSSTFIGPEYIPDIKIDDMKDNVKPEERTVSADDVAANLAALKKLQNKTKSIFK